MSIDSHLLDKLVCPATRTPLRYDPERQELISDEAGIAYPLLGGMPIMLIEEVRRLGEAAD